MMSAGLGGRSIHTHTLTRARVTDPAWVWMSAVAIPLMLVLPALYRLLHRGSETLEEIRHG